MKTRRFCGLLHYEVKEGVRFQSFPPNQIGILYLGTMTPIKTVALYVDKIHKQHLKDLRTAGRSGRCSPLRGSHNRGLFSTSITDGSSGPQTI